MTSSDDGSERPGEAPFTASAEAVGWATLHALPDAVLIVEDDGRIVFANRPAEALFGYDGDGLVGELVEILVPPALADTHRVHRGRYNDEPRTRAMGAGLTLFAVRRDGTQFATDISLSPLVDGPRRLTIAAIRPFSDEQRSQLAQEVVETVIYRLVSIGMSLQAVLDGPADALQRRAREVVEHIDETTREIRTMIFATRDDDPDDASNP
jgi:PAS domain S-box-containing protein